MSESKKELPKAYEPKGVEDAIYAAWLKSGFFAPENLPNLESRTEVFTIMLPPPNVTGTLHMGHAVLLAVEDAMIRFNRMNGKRVLWLPGTDHAAIATESKVEKLIIESEGKNRHDLGREVFLDRVSKFAQESHDTIVNQMKKMGASVDWGREAYTLDDARNLAVKTAFKQMFDDGLIYRGHRVINWDPKGQTTVSDDEVEYKEVQAKLYTFKYSKDFPISIATTRPETKVGDTAVAVHPDDKRYAEFVGKEYKVDFAGVTLNIKIIADPHIEKDFGTGALGVTPAHSIIDADLARTHSIPSVVVIGKDGRMTKEAGTLIAGQTTLEARESVVAWLKENDLLEAEEEMTQNLSVAQRSGGVIEPLPMEQWFIDVNKEFNFKQSPTNPIQGLENGEQVTLKKLMQHVVKSQQVKIIPERFDKTYFHWIDNLRDWNISRQIWFGHRVPVWYRGEDMHVGVEEPEGEGWMQDEDTLDTWFSSGLWTFSTLGWPHETDDLNTHHPTSVLETGYDILFFWVARMILMSTYLLGEVPFREVYLHGLVRDEKGKKMSKSLGNVIDPLIMIEKYGADATRLSLMIGATPGNDMKISEEKVAAYRNFTNKLWNISRFVLITVETVAIVDSVEAKTLSDKWILGRLSEVIEKVTGHFEKHEFSLAGETLREFTWSEFADWYLEIAKVQLRNPEEKDNTEQVLLYVLQNVLKLWHPFMPFVTEELNKEFGSEMLIVAKWPKSEHRLLEADGETFSRLQEVVSAIRNIRAKYQIGYGTEIDIILQNADRIEGDSEIIRSLAKVGKITFTHKDNKPQQSASVVIGPMQLHVPLAGVVDLGAEKAKVEKELAEATDYVRSLAGTLNNEGFRANADDKVIAMKEKTLNEAKERVEKLEEVLKSL